MLRSRLGDYADHSWLADMQHSTEPRLTPWQHIVFWLACLIALLAEPAIEALF